MARQFLWRAGLDFDHGTGHGVGSYLSVHEGPARISKLGGAPLKRGMILSNEPGYYRAGAYGIRIENLVLVTEAAPAADAEKPLNAFETLTLAPIDRAADRAAIAYAPRKSPGSTAYHARVRETLAPLVDAPTRDWLYSGDDAASGRLNCCGARNYTQMTEHGTFIRERRFFAGLNFASAIIGKPLPASPGGCTERGNVMLSTILIIVLVLLLIGALPTWPYSSGWGYYPGGGLGLILVVVIVLALAGRI